MSKNRIIKRLARELKELNREPLLGTNAAPVSDDNLLEWHCTTLGPPGTPYENTPFHWVLEFPDNYPTSAPKAYFTIKFYVGGAKSMDNKGRYAICMNIFSNWEDHHREWKDKMEGWSPSMTISTILINFQSVLNDKEFISHRKSDVENTHNIALKFKCKDCGHDGSNYEKYFPEVLPWPKPNQKVKNEKTNDTLKNKSEGKSKDEKSNKNSEKSSREKPQKIKFEPFCYATRQTIADDDTPILGFGLNLKYNAGGDLISIESPYEFISLEAFNDGFRRTSLKKKFEYWLPLFINEQHWTCAKSEFETRVQKHLKTNFNKDNKHILLISYFSLMLYNLFNSCNNQINSHFIDGYFAIYRTLLAYESEFKDFANQKIEELISASLMNSETPSYTLDFWMVLIFLSRYEWSDIAEIILQEIDIRNVGEYLKEHPQLNNFILSPPEERAVLVFRNYRPFLLRVAFYVGFYQQIRGIVFSDLDKNNGKLDPNTHMILKMVGQEVINMNSWQDFYQWTGISFDSNFNIGKKLIKSMLLAKKLKYIEGVSFNYDNKFVPFNFENQSVDNCPNKNQIYHRCTIQCYNKYGNQFEKRNPLKISSFENNDCGLEFRVQMQKESDWLRQSC